MVADAFGNVNVLVDVVGPVNAVKPFAVPPLAADNIPVQPNVILTDCNSDVVGLPPKVKVTFVSSVFVRLPAAVYEGAATPPVALPK